MSNYAPGWYPDALGRFAQRYYDGNAWTEHVADAAGNRATDPVQSPPPPQPQAAGTFAPPSANSGATGWTSSASAPAPSGPSPTTGWTSSTAPAAPSASPAAAPTVASASTGSVAITVGLLVASAGALLALLSIFGLDYWSADGVGVGLGDIADAPDEADINGLVSAYAGFGRFLGLLVIALAIVAVLRLPALKQYQAQLPLIAAGAAGLFGLWHLIGLFMSPDMFDAGPAFGGFIGVVGYAGMAAGQFLRQPIGNVSR